MKMLIAAASFAAVLGAASAAGAMPVAPLGAGRRPAVNQVGPGWGPGWGRGPMGRSSPMYRRPPVVVVPPRVVAPRACPPGYFWRGGRCLRRF